MRKANDAWNEATRSVPLTPEEADMVPLSLNPLTRYRQLRQYSREFTEHGSHPGNPVVFGRTELYIAAAQNAIYASVERTDASTERILAITEEMKDSISEVS